MMQKLNSHCFENQRKQSFHVELDRNIKIHLQKSFLLCKLITCMCSNWTSARSVPRR